jgi:hypothetical protein
MRSLTLAVLFFVAPALTGADVKPPAGFEVRTLRGFTVLIHDDVQAQKADRWQRKPLDVLEAEFDDLRRILNPKLFEMVRQIPIWVRWHTPDSTMPDAVAFYFGHTGPQMRARGKDPLLANSIELVTLKRLGELRPPGSKFQQVILLHELAHAIHHRLLGFDSAEVKGAYQTAVERKLYDRVTDRTGRIGRAYARTNDAEYFAEISCAFLDSCFYYPFTYQELRDYDPAGFALTESVWKRPEQYLGRQPTVETARFATTTATAAPGMVILSATEAERLAFEQVTKARGLIREGRVDEAKRVLDTLLKYYPTTIAADDARLLRGGLK